VPIFGKESVKSVKSVVQTYGAVQQINKKSGQSILKVSSSDGTVGYYGQSILKANIFIWSK